MILPNGRSRTLVGGLNLSAQPLMLPILLHFLLRWPPLWSAATPDRILIRTAFETKSVPLSQGGGWIDHFESNNIVQPVIPEPYDWCLKREGGIG